MEPGRKGREYLRLRSEPLEHRLASMEPDRKGREYRSGSAPPLGASCRLNGARPQRPGIQEPMHLIRTTTPWPQWSPAAKAGNTRVRPLGLHLPLASMEPGRKGREYLASPCRMPRLRYCLNGARPQRPGIRHPSPEAAGEQERLNGARPQRPGIPSSACERSGGPPGLNGARPQRPGIRARRARLCGELVHASMEPGRKGREYSRPTRDRPVVVSPQWSPAAKAGNTCRAAGSPRRGAAPQWSPAAQAGNTRPRTGIPMSCEMPQWSPAAQAGNT